MQLNVTTDYAIRAVLFLATVNRAATGAEICRSMAIPRNMLAAMSCKLQDAGVIVTTRGSSGGYSLARRPEDISLSLIINTMEGTTRINRCLEEDHLCSRNATETCPVRAFYVKIQQYLDETFEAKTIASLME